MRLLADNPSMDFLRQEAKELLAALREGDAKATLSDAQRALAADYGFRTWSDLKLEVEQRRESLPPAPEGLADALSAAFGLGAVKSIAPIRYEYMGRRWCLDTERGRYLVTPVFDWICDDTQNVCVDLQERARAAGVLSTVPVRTPDGGLVRTLQDQNWRVDEWVDLGPTPAVPLQSSVARQLGAVLAAIHSVAPATDRPITGMWVADRPSEESWAMLAEKAHASNKPWAAEFSALSRNVTELSQITAGPEDDRIIGNRDLQPGSVRLGPADDLVVTHWDFAGPTTRDTELAIMLTSTGLHAPEIASAVIAGYRERSGGELPPLTLHSFAASVTGWLTWANHRACELLGGADTEEQIEFAERSLREVLDDPLTVAQLQALLDT
jgi:Ser/Thr protein kinase RdoA (MazF antagonist)